MTIITRIYHHNTDSPAFMISGSCVSPASVLPVQAASVAKSELHWVSRATYRPDGVVCGGKDARAGRPRARHSQRRPQRRDARTVLRPGLRAKQQLVSRLPRRPAAPCRSQPTCRLRAGCSAGLATAAAGLRGTSTGRPLRRFCRSQSRLACRLRKPAAPPASEAGSCRLSETRARGAQVSALTQAGRSAGSAGSAARNCDWPAGFASRLPRRPRRPAAAGFRRRAPAAPKCLR